MQFESEDVDPVVESAHAKIIGSGESSFSTPNASPMTLLQTSADRKRLRTTMSCEDAATSAIVHQIVTKREPTAAEGRMIGVHSRRGGCWGGI